MDLAEYGPEELAGQILAEHGDDPTWLDTFVDQLSGSRSARQITRVLEAWGMSQAEFAGLMGVSRQAVGKWMVQVPAERAVEIADLAAATDILEHYLKRDRIPAVVRRPASALGDQSVVDLIAADGTSAALDACRRMFDTAAISA